MRRGTGIAVLVAFTVLATACGGETTTSAGDMSSPTVPSTMTPSPGSDPHPSPSSEPTVKPSPAPSGTTGSQAIDPASAGPGWTLAVHDSASEIDGGVGPTRLLLVSPSGGSAVIGEWPAETFVEVVDWTPDGSAALLRVGIDSTSAVLRLDLATGARTTIADGGTDTYLRGGFTRPTGRNVVVHRSSFGEDEVLERRDADGYLLATLLTSAPSDQPPFELQWLYALDGRSLVVSGRSSLQRIGNDGSVQDSIEVPGRACNPVRWWPSGALLVTCLDGPEDTYYGRLWLVPVADPGAATPLTGPRPEDAPVVDMGYVDAIPTEGATLLQWVGDCGAAGVHRLEPDGAGTRIDVASPTGAEAFLLGVANGRMYVRTSGGCDTGGDLISAALDGSDVRVLVARQDGERGVTSAVTMPAG